MLLLVTVWIISATQLPAADQIVADAAPGLHLQHDAALADAAQCLAYGAVRGDKLSIPALRLCARRAGVYDSLLLPVIAVHRGAAGLIEGLTPFFASEARERKLTHFGAAVIVADAWVYLAVLTTLRRAELAVEPEPTEPGDLLMFSGVLRTAHSGARAFLSSPAGVVSRVSLKTVPSDRRVFQGSILLPQESGRYQLEIVGDTEHGPIVVANRAVFVGADLPIRPSRNEQAPYGETAAEKIWAMMNLSRAKAGLPPYVFDRDISKVAQRHAEHMRARRYFGHDTLTTSERSAATVVMRLKDAGIYFAEAGENIAESASIEDAHDSLMNSPGHRDSILSPLFKQVGIGIAEGTMRTGDPCVYVVVDFVSPTH